MACPVIMPMMQMNSMRINAYDHNATLPQLGSRQEILHDVSSPFLPHALGLYLRSEAAVVQVLPPSQPATRACCLPRAMAPEDWLWQFWHCTGTATLHRTVANWGIFAAFDIHTESFSPLNLRRSCRTYRMHPRHPEQYRNSCTLGTPAPSAASMQVACN